MPFSSKHKFFYRISFKSVWPLFILECVCWGVEGNTLFNLVSEAFWLDYIMKEKWCFLFYFVET